MLPQNSLLSIALTLLMLWQPLSVLARDCCCRSKVETSVAPRAAKCPHCQTANEVTRKPTSKETIRPQCPCDRETKPVGLTARRPVIDIAVASRVERHFGPLHPVIQSVSTTPKQAPGESSGRKIRILNCSWLA